MWGRTTGPCGTGTMKQPRTFSAITRSIRNPSTTSRGTSDKTPAEGRQQPASEGPRDGVDGVRILLVIAENVLGCFIVPVPHGPVVRPHIQHVRSDLLVVRNAFVDLEALW